MSFSAESLFGFDRSTVQPEGRSALDAFAGKLAGPQFDQITVKGHTDGLDTEAYNQQLSQRRADAVKSHLVTESKVDAGKITAKGHGRGQTGHPEGRLQGACTQRQADRLSAA